MRFAVLVLAVLQGTLCARGQWTLQDSGTAASLRGIHAVSAQVAWASGSGGTVLRTIDGGAHWLHCAVPDADKDGAKLDFRGVQAFDAKTALVMSSGKGDLSRLYKTVDGCGTWKLVFTNPDVEGFWDALSLSNSRSEAMIIGDPVNNHFAIFRNEYWRDNGEGEWKKFEHSIRSPKVEIASANRGESLFAASNSALLGSDQPNFVTGGASGSYFYGYQAHRSLLMSLISEGWYYTFTRKALPLARGDSAGAFSVATRRDRQTESVIIVVVGGDYEKPAETKGTAAFGIAKNSGMPSRFAAAIEPPHGYRSAVAYEEVAHTWLTVGPNGTDVSADDGCHWRPLSPGPSDVPDADKNWNALSLPFVVGAKGRVGVLRADALTAAPK